MALAARIVLALVLAVSAAAKLRTREAVRRQVSTLVGPGAERWIAPLLPISELVVAVALVVWWGPVPGVVAVVLLALFTVVLVRAQARRVPCLCFGASTLATPVGPASIVRNGLLGALAVLAIGSPSGAPGGAFVALVVVLGGVSALAVRAAR